MAASEIKLIKSCKALLLVIVYSLRIYNENINNNSVFFFH